MSARGQEMTGSGKTDLCMGVWEDLALRGVPVLAGDPDLANMALVFPELTPDAFRPWNTTPAATSAAWSAATEPGATPAAG